MSKQRIVHRGLEINSPGHLRLCEALEELGLAYCLESPLVLPGDRLSSGKNYRKADLIIFNNDFHLFVEIDGITHDEPDQMVDDYMRDYYIFRSCGSLSLRFSHRYVLKRPMDAAGLIWSSLSRSTEDDILSMGGNWLELVKGRRAEETTIREKEWKRHERQRYAIGERDEPLNIVPKGVSLLRSIDMCDGEKNINEFLENQGIASQSRIEDLTTIVNCMMIVPSSIDKYILLAEDEGPSNKSVIDFCEFITAGVVAGLGLSEGILIEEIRRISLARTKERLISENRILPSILKD